MRADVKFPNLFIIGAMKAGTSSLHEYLHQHPQIFMSRMKEPQYFAPHSTRWGQKWGQGYPYPEPGIGWYEKLFEPAGDVKYAGESSVSYTAMPWVTGCAQRIHRFNPEARLIYLMRDPIERTMSHYWHFVADGREDRDILSAIRKNEDYVARSYYAMQLHPYLETFGRQRIFLLTLEELTADPDATFRRLYTWLEIDPDFQVRVDQKYNVGSIQLRQTRRGLVFIDRFLQGWRWRRIKRHFPPAVPRFVERVAYKIVDRNQVDVDPTVRYLRPILQQYTDELAHLIGRDFPEWRMLYTPLRATAIQMA